MSEQTSSPIPMDTENTRMPILDHNGVEEVLVMAKDIHGIWRVVVNELVLSENVDDLKSAVEEYAL